MKKLIFSAFSIWTVLSMDIYAQGISWEDLSYSEALTKAKEENKMVFIDFYTDWCGPCKRLDRDVFPLQEVGGVFNAKFINIKIDAEKGEGPEIALKYNVRNYPTLQFVDTRGAALHRVVGYMPSSHLIENARISLDPSKRLQSWNNRYANGERDIAFLMNYIQVLEKARDVDQLLRVGEEFIAYTPKDQLINANAFSIIEQTKALFYGSQAYEYLLAKKDKFEAIEGVIVVPEKIEGDNNRRWAFNPNRYDAVMTACILKYLRGKVVSSSSLNELNDAIAKAKNEYPSDRLGSFEKGAANQYYLAHDEYEKWFEVNDAEARKALQTDKDAGFRMLLQIGGAVAQNPDFSKMDGSYERAIGLLNECVKINKKQLTTYSYLASLYMYIGDKKSAIKNIDKYFKGYPGAVNDPYATKLRKKVYAMTDGQRSIPVSTRKKG